MKSKEEMPASSSLNRMLSQKNDLKAKTASPNKLFIFKVRNNQSKSGIPAAK